MTCIVGITDGRTVTVGGDSAGSDGWHVAVLSDSKVFQVGPYLMGFTTSYRMGQLLRYSLTDDYQIGHTISGYAAVGSGYLVALGSLHSTARSPVGSRQRAVMALEAAAQLTEGVRPPFTVVQSDGGSR